MGLYNKYVLPKFLNCACGSKPINYQRKKVVPLAEGIVLDVGIGSGLNIPFYDMTKIDKILGLDPSEELNNIAIGKFRTPFIEKRINQYIVILMGIIIVVFTLLSYFNNV